MLITIIILTILLILLIIYIIINSLNKDKILQKYKKEGSDECFNMILQAGYQNRVKNFKGCNRVSKKGGIVFVGDSLTENYNVYEYFKGYDVYNRGIGGDTTVGLLNRMDESIFELSPKIVILLIGINDFELVEGSNSLTISNNIKKIISLIKEKSSETKIILESIYHVCKKDSPKIDKNAIVRKDNEKIDEVNCCLENIDGIIYVDMNEILTSQDGSLKEEYTLEGLHVNSLAYEVITKRLKEEIDKINI